MKNKAKKLLTDQTRYEIAEQSNKNSALQNEQNIGQQNIQSKEYSPLHSKRTQQQQQLKQQGLLTQLSQLSSPNRYKQNTDRINLSQLETEKGNEKNLNLQKDLIKQKPIFINDITNNDYSSNFHPNTIKEKENHINSSILKSALSLTGRKGRSKENETILENSNKKSEISNVNRIFVEDSLFSKNNIVLNDNLNLKETYNFNDYCQSKLNSKKLSEVQSTLPFQDVQNHLVPQSRNKDQQRQSNSLKKITQNTSFSVNSVNNSSRNIFVGKGLNQISSTLNQTQQLLGFHTIRNRQHNCRMSDQINENICKDKLSRDDQRSKFLFKEQNENLQTSEYYDQKDILLQQNIQSNRISNNILENNYSFQNKISYYNKNSNLNTSTIKSQDRTFQNESQKLFNSHRKVASSEIQINKFNNTSMKSDSIKQIFDQNKLIQDHNNCRQKLSELFLKYKVDNDVQKNINTQPTDDSVLQLNSQKQINNMSIQKSPSTNKVLQEPNQNYFHLNFKNFNNNLKQQLKTASNFNNQFKDYNDILKKTKQFFSSKQSKNTADSQSNNSQQSNQFFSTSQNQIQLNSIVPLDNNQSNTKINPHKQSKQKSPFKSNSLLTNQLEQKHFRKVNKRGSSLVEQLEYEYNNLYFNNNQSAQSMIFQNSQTNNVSQFLYNDIRSSPQIQNNFTPYQSFANFNNQNKQRKFSNINQNIQHISQVSTLNNLNLLEFDDEIITNSNTEQNKLQCLQKSSTIFLRSPTLKHCMTLDQQQLTQQDCREVMNYFIDMRRALQEELLQDQSFIDVIEKKLIINIEQFFYFLSHFWKFCIENFDKFENDFAIFKIEEKYLQKMTDIMKSTLYQQENLSKDKINIFINSFTMHSQRLMVPKNLFENIGKFQINFNPQKNQCGEKQAQKLINDIINILKFDISIGVYFGKILNELDLEKAGKLFCSFLKDEIDGIKDAIVYTNKNLNVTQVEFFLIKQAIYSVLHNEKLILKNQKMIIIEKFEKLRAFILQDRTQLDLLQDNVIHEALMIKIRNTNQIFQHFRSKERQSLVDFASFTFSMIFGRSTIAEYAEKLKNEILLQPQSFLSVIQDQIIDYKEINNDKEQQEYKNEKLLKLINVIENLTLEAVNDFKDLSSMFNTEKHIKLKFQFLREHITQEYPMLRNNGKNIIKELRIWAVSNFKKYIKNIEITESENSRLEVMDSILKFYFYRDSDVFSFYDVPTAINYFPISRNAIEYWLIGLKSVLSEETLNIKTQEIDKIIEQISSLFSVSWVKKKNQLYFIQPPRV